MTEQPRKKRRKKRPFLVLLIIVALIVAGILVAHLDYFNVTGVAVIGNQEITDEEIIHLSQIEIGESVFDVHPFLVKHRIKDNLHIKDVKVSRKLPSTVEITVKEKKCTAQFLFGKKYVVTDRDGLVIEVASEQKKSTLVEGMIVKEANKGKNIKVKDEKNLEKALDFISITQKNDLFFKKISFEGKRVNAYVYDELNCTGKYSNVVSCIESGTLKSVIYDLYQKGTEKGTVNVYNNDYCFFTP